MDCSFFSRVLVSILNDCLQQSDLPGFFLHSSVCTRCSSPTCAAGMQLQSCGATSDAVCKMAFVVSCTHRRSLNLELSRLSWMRSLRNISRSRAPDDADTGRRGASRAAGAGWPHAAIFRAARSNVRAGRARSSVRAPAAAQGPTERPGGALHGRLPPRPFGAAAHWQGRGRCSTLGGGTEWPGQGGMLHGGLRGLRLGHGAS
jgi:hypothetical protein